MKSNVVLKERNQMAKSVKVKGSISDGLLKATNKHVLTHRVLADIDLGTIEVQDGYKLCVALVPAWASRGLVAANTPGNFTSGKANLMVVNVGREIVEIKAGDVVASCWVEPILKMDVELT